MNHTFSDAQEEGTEANRRVYHSRLVPHYIKNFEFRLTPNEPVSYVVAAPRYIKVVHGAIFIAIS